MNTTEIELLLEKFYEGETTPQEEKILSDFFNGKDIPPHLSVHTPMFRFLKEEQKAEITDPDFEERFLSAIGETPVISLKSRRNRILYFSGIAASIVLIAGLMFTFRSEIFRKEKINPEEAAIAYQQVKTALAMVSGNLNTGLSQAQKLGEFSKGLDQVQRLQTFQTGIDKMNKLSKFYQYQTIIINPGDNNRP